MLRQAKFSNRGGTRTSAARAERRFAESASDQRELEVQSARVPVRRRRKIVPTDAWRGRILIVTMLLTTAGAVAGSEQTVDELKGRLSAASSGDKPHLCVQIAQKQLAEADKLYAAGEVEKAQAAVTDVVAFSEMARDYSIQSHKYQKQAEIAVRTMVRKLADIKHVVAHEDQPPIDNAISRLQRVRDDLLSSMFPKGAK
jgi:hypothetical protein